MLVCVVLVCFVQARYFCKNKKNLLQFMVTEHSTSKQKHLLYDKLIE